MSENMTNHLELRAELEARGWSAADFHEWLELIGHPVAPRVVLDWLNRDAIENGGECPRWPVLLMQGMLGAQEWPRLRYFKPHEFGVWGPWMARPLLYALDAVRHALGVPLRVSAAAGALGRHLQNGTSMHNVDRMGCCMAADMVLPKRFPLYDAFQIVCGVEVVSGLGLYPEWNQGPGLHLDVRHLSPWNITKGATVRNPATWSAVKGAGGAQVYHSVEFVLKR